METKLDAIFTVIEDTGLDSRGAFHPAQDDKVPDCGFETGVHTVVMVGNVGGSMWPVFEAGRRDESDALDKWTRRVLAAITAKLTPIYGAVVSLHPSDGPPYYPFQKWAMRAEPVFPSPIGPLIHPEHGLWHAYRGALMFERRLTIPNRAKGKSPCESCEHRPCLSTCPVSAFSPGQYDIQACANHLTTTQGDVCLAEGCLARKACPVGRQNAYSEAQTRFHMTLIRDKHATR